MSKDTDKKSFLSKMRDYFTPHSDDDDEYNDSDDGGEVYSSLYGRHRKAVEEIPEDSDKDYNDYGNENYANINFNDSYNREEDMNEITLDNENTKAYSMKELVIMKPNFILDDYFTSDDLRENIEALIKSMKEKNVIHLDLGDLEDKEAGIYEFACIGACSALNYGITEIARGLMFILTPKGVKVSREERLVYSKEGKNNGKEDEDSGYRYSNDY